jgi:ABC-type branched-subunit amino acid transport system substrate-binding protein
MKARHLLVALAALLTLAGGASGATRTDPGVTSTSILLGGTAAISGPESAYYAPVAKGAQAYFAYVNARGGVNGRKIEYKVVDDAYDPAQTVQATRQLVQQDGVFAIFNSIGTEHMIAVRPFLNQAKVPQLFVGSGSRAILSGRTKYPWTLGFLPSFYGEGKLYGRYVAAHSPKARVAILYENDDYGKDLRDGAKAGLGGKAKIVGTTSYELTDADMSSQIASLKASKADTLMLFALPKQVIQAFLAAHKLGWKPQYFVSAVSIDPFVMTVVAASAGKRTTEGALSSAFLKVATDPSLAKDPGAKLYKSIMKTYCQGCDPNALAHIYGMASAFTMVDALRHAGKNLSRDSLLRAATHLNEKNNPFLQPGITITTSATDYLAFEKLRMFRYHNARWTPFGKFASVRP